MPALTRRRDPDAQQETWQIYYGDVRVGTISEETGKPTGTPSWQWVCGFYPGNPAEHARGSAKTYDQARGAFEIAWHYFLAKCTEADFDDYRRNRAFHAWKEAMSEASLKLPTQVADDRATPLDFRYRPRATEDAWRCTKAEVFNGSRPVLSIWKRAPTSQARQQS